MDYLFDLNSSTHPTCIWPPHGFTSVEFRGNFRRQKTRLTGLFSGVVCLFDPKFIRFGRTPTCDRQTDTDTGP